MEKTEDGKPDDRYVSSSANPATGRGPLDRGSETSRPHLAAHLHMRGLSSGQLPGLEPLSEEDPAEGKSAEG